DERELDVDLDRRLRRRRRRRRELADLDRAVERAALLAGVDGEVAAAAVVRRRRRHDRLADLDLRGGAAVGLVRRVRRGLAHEDDERAVGDGLVDAVLDVQHLAFQSANDVAELVVDAAVAVEVDGEVGALLGNHHGVGDVLSSVRAARRLAVAAAAVVAATGGKGERDERKQANHGALHVEPLASGWEGHVITELRVGTPAFRLQKPLMGSDGFTWSGSLDETDIQSLYAACQSLRFSGKLELRDGATKAEVTFVGGEPIEIDGGDTQRIALWNRGTFRAVQSIPNLAGELTGQREMEGSLAITKASQLWAWVSEYRLTCDIDLERPGSKALVAFQNGHAESAQVNGAPELAALARVSSWTDGTFRVKLKPLFIEGVIAAPPPMPESAPPAGRQFDVSRSIPMDLKIREQQRLQTAQASFG